MRLTRLHSYIIGILICVPCAWAAPLEAAISFPDGLIPGVGTRVQVELKPGSDGAEGERLLRELKGTPISLLVSGGQNGEKAVQEIPLGKIGDAALATITFEPTVSTTYHFGVHFNALGARYGFVGEVPVPSDPVRLRIQISDPPTRNSLPLAQFLIWAAGASVCGLVALRGAKAF